MVRGPARLDPDRLVYLDEAAANTQMARRYGRAPRSRCYRIAEPHEHHKTTTVTAALRSTGLVATTLFDGATNGERFRGYVADTLLPVLNPGDTVFLDNLQAHKVAGVCEAIEVAGARLLHLPPYLPDINPIELAFAKVKALLRSAAAAPSQILGMRSKRHSPASHRVSAATASPKQDTKTTWPSLHEREQL